LTSQPILSPRRIVGYNRLSSDMAALTYVLRTAKPGSALGPSTIRACNAMIWAANRLYRREVGLPELRLAREDEPFTLTDLAIVIARLSAAGLTFEARYADYTKAIPPAPSLDADGLPSKHL